MNGSLRVLRPICFAAPNIALSPKTHGERSTKARVIAHRATPVEPMVLLEKPCDWPKTPDWQPGGGHFPPVIQPLCPPLETKTKRVEVRRAAHRSAKDRFAA